MNRTLAYSSRSALLVALWFLMAAPVWADVQLPAVLGSHMVLQRDVPLPIWGTAESGEKVTVNLEGHQATATADAQGNWRVTLPAMKSDGKPHQLTVSGNNTITLHDILIGEVWLGSGQSNMEWPVARSEGGKAAIAVADHPEIRLFHVPKVKSSKPAADVKADWKVCTPQTIPSFSAVLYFFGAKLQEEVDVPVGLINSSWGGSPIEPWTITESGSGAMYNGMIAPLLPFPVRGAIWYQGESNCMGKVGLAYQQKMNDLIQGWRGVWNNDQLPFYFVQIAPFNKYPDGELPKLWEAQAATLKLPHTGMAVVTDLVPDLNNIHPTNKRDVGDRLARWALVKDYGTQHIPYSGPLFVSQEIEGDKIRLHFAHTAGGLKSRDEKPLSHFQIAGEDEKFVPANATIEEDAILVQADGVTAPKYARFGWHRSAIPNLVNGAGLPAAPFQTNNWQGGTGH